MKVGGRIRVKRNCIFSQMGEILHVCKKKKGALGGHEIEDKRTVEKQEGEREVISPLKGREEGERTQEL